MRHDIDTSKSHLTWHASKVTGKHHGSVALKSGFVEIDTMGLLTGGEFVIDMPTITDEDISNARLKETLENHLKSADFFDVETYPEARLVITNVKTSENETTILCDLTIRGKTSTVEFPAQIKQVDSRWMADATVAFDRTRWDITFRSGKFFQNLGDILIHDEIKLDVHVETK